MLVIMDERLVKELITARNAVKNKYQRLKSDIAQSEYALQRHFRPITQPIQELVTHIKREGDVEVKDESRSTQPSFNTFSNRRGSSSAIVTSTPTKRKYGRKSSPHSTTGDVSFLPTYSIGEIGLDTVLNETPSTSSEVISSQAAFDEYLDQYQGLAREYVEDLYTNDKDDPNDHYYGVRLNPKTSKYTVGNASLDFVGENIVITPPSGDSETFTGTKGLYELLFKKAPNHYTETDKQVYQTILHLTNAFRKDYVPNGRILGTGKKYTTIIKPLVNPNTTATPKRGRGLQMLKLHNKPLEFIPWKNPNKLINWLRTLISSKSAGHTGHNNEIIYIIDELRSARIIK